ncbi:MAG: SMP-30/gluconolactonase/LRE family protein [Deltaproteobacteria bacterium]|nr:SMP-30/gluconolactonase/LRE family protein [Deltaproteobacteria bacterium]
MKINLSDIRTIGTGLQRPEGIMAADDGTLYTADMRGGCCRINTDGKTTFWGSLGGVPNGICIDRSGNCIVANIGLGEVQSLAADGSHRVLIREAGGRRIPAPNFPFLDSKERLWVSNSTSRADVESALGQPAPDGSIVLLEKGVARIVAEEIFFANGVALDRDESRLYVAETMKRRILRYKIDDDGSLYEREVYGPDFLGKRGFPDGIAFDEDGNLWIAFPTWNAIGLLTPKQELVMVLEDPRGEILKQPSNICFGWEERKTAFIGCIDSTTIPCFKAPAAGLRLVHQQ